MSLAFTLRVRASRRVAVLIGAAHLCALAGVAAAAFRLAHAGLILPAGTVAGLCLPVLWSWYRRPWARPAASGWLRVDEHGEARWCAPSAGGLEPLRWFAAGGIAWIEARTPDGVRNLLLGRDQASDAEWQSLARWLRWLERSR